MGKKWVKIPGSGLRIACGADGNAWVSNKQRNIYQYTGRGWKHINGKANDIGVGHDGSVWVVGNNREGGGFGIYMRGMSISSNWQRINGAARDIDADGSGL